MPKVTVPTTRLLGNHPNPFNPRTTIRFELANSAPVKIGIYSVDGLLVRRVNLGAQQPGVGQWIWDGNDDTGRRASSGTYYVTLQAGAFVDRLPVTLLK